MNDNNKDRLAGGCVLIFALIVLFSMIIAC